MCYWLCTVVVEKKSLMIALLKQLEKTSFPQFESFIIEEEEGSGMLLSFAYLSDGRFLFLLISTVPNIVHNVFRWLWNCLQGSKNK